jgi:hypothetical protein
MDRLSTTHLKALEFEREQYLKEHHWQRLVKQARRENKLQKKTVGWARASSRVLRTSLFILLFGYLILAILRENLKPLDITLENVMS